MKHWHMAACAVLAVIALALIVSGVEGAVLLLPAFGCVLMMGAMVWMMVRMARH